MVRYILIAFLASMLVSCYEDLGNYKYHDINELTIDSIKTIYTIDQFDTLKIEPQLAGTMYADVTRFTYSWEIDGKIVGSELSLCHKIMNSPGEKYCRFIIEDLGTGIKEYCYFTTNVVSTTAADGIMLLSDYKGHSELSFKRLDQEAAPFQVNFFYDMNKTYLGTKPDKMVQLYSYEVNGDGEIYGLHVLSDNDLKRISHRTLLLDSIYPVYNKDYFKSLVPVNPGYPDFGNFDVENMYTDELSWQGDFMGPFQYMVSDIFMVKGKYFTVQQATTRGGTYALSYLRESALAGELSPVSFYVSKTKVGEFGSLFYNIGYSVSTYRIMFDKTNHRFLYGANSGQSAFKEITEFSALNLESYEPVFGSPTRNVNNPFVVLSDGANFRCLMLQAPRNDSEYAQGQTTGIKFKVVGDYTVPAGQMDKFSDFYCYVTDEYFYFSTGSVLYSVNIQGMINGTWDAREICRLSDFGYDTKATINCFDFARSGNHVILGVSRDGKHKGETSDELNGDVVVLTINKANNAMALKQKYEHVGGTPADIIIKYLTYFCEGYDSNKKFRDYL